MQIQHFAENFYIPQCHDRQCWKFLRGLELQLRHKKQNQHTLVDLQHEHGCLEFHRNRLQEKR